MSFNKQKICFFETSSNKIKREEIEQNKIWPGIKIYYKTAVIKTQRF